MGFESQVTEILDAMGSTLKSEEEELAYIEAEKAQQGKGHCRVTTMFSATMLPDVERIAKRYLRHPAVVKIGDESTGKNKRIEQIVHMITDQQKRGKLNEVLARLSDIDKVIIFLNNKNSCDVVGKFVESLSYRVGILHSRKSQDQREETLERFRDGHYKVLVATDVAGRGLDIKDVTYVINYDCPLKIDDYCHRIGRTGRAGKSGTAITFLTDSDTEIMFPLRNYLESTNAIIPQQLKHHPNAQASSGARDEKGNIIVNSGKREKIQYAK